MRKKIHIGTSGWNYKHWIGKFYPEDLKQKDWLQFYIDKGLHTVELNNPFYHLPTKKTFENWNKQAPRDFIFAVKASRYITHMKKLLEPEKSLKNFISNVKGLNEKLGPVLFQLPPRWKYNSSRFKEFLQSLPENFRYTFEFRNETWWNDEALNLLNEYKCAFCIFELAGQITPNEVTTDFVYVRLHGPGNKYQGKYDTKTLTTWKNNFLKWHQQKKAVYCYFDNDDSAYAAENAIELNEMINE